MNSNSMNIWEEALSLLRVQKGVTLGPLLKPILQIDFLRLLELETSVSLADASLPLENLVWAADLKDQEVVLVGEKFIVGFTAKSTEGKTVLEGHVVYLIRKSHTPVAVFDKFIKDWCAPDSAKNASNLKIEKTWKHTSINPLFENEAFARMTGFHAPLLESLAVGSAIVEALNIAGSFETLTLRSPLPLYEETSLEFQAATNGNKTEVWAPNVHLNLS